MTVHSIIIVILIICCIVLYDRLSKADPFERTFLPKQYSFSALPGTRCSFRFTDKADRYTLRTAIHHAMYVNPRIDSLYFDESLIHLDVDSFAPFHFYAMNFSNVSESVFFKAYGTFPCECLTLPSDMIEIPPELLEGGYHAIIITAKTLARPTYTPDRPIRVPDDFRVIVPDFLYYVYNEHKTWADFRIKYDDGKVYPITFDSL